MPRQDIIFPASGHLSEHVYEKLSPEAHAPNDFCSRFNWMNNLYCSNLIIVQNVAAITTLKFGWQQYDIVIEF